VRARHLPERVLLADEVAQRCRASACPLQPAERRGGIARLQLELAEVDGGARLDDAVAARGGGRARRVELRARAIELAEIGEDETKVVVRLDGVFGIVRRDGCRQAEREEPMRGIELAARLLEEPESRVRLRQLAVEADPTLERERFLADALRLIVPAKSPGRVAARGELPVEGDRFGVGALVSDRAVVYDERAVEVALVERVAAKKARHGVGRGGALCRAGRRRCVALRSARHEHDGDEPRTAPERRAARHAVRAVGH
jgi:hypothetical protein